MKKAFTFFILICLVSSVLKSNTIPYSFAPANADSVLVKQYVILTANNISSFFYNTGVFNQDMRTGNTAGFEWPKGSGKTAIFTSGLCLIGMHGSQGRMASASYKGEFQPGYTMNKGYYHNTGFKMYTVKTGDNCSNNPDYANWGLMVPYGAPYYDVNANGVYDACIDIPGVKNSAQTIFQCITDANGSAHNSGEGFGGGTLPLYAEVHMTSWSYTIPGMEDVQFMKWEIVNKSDTAWTKFYAGLFYDSDIGSSNDDYNGCDTTRNLGYSYNAAASDLTYGANPPAAGVSVLRGLKSGSDSIKMNSFAFLSGTGSSTPPCEVSLSVANIYNFFRGYKNDETPYLVPGSLQQTKYCYSGDPETASGWTEYVGKINNCGGTLTGDVVASAPGDKRFLIGIGKDNFTFAPGQKQTIVTAQLVAQGVNNKNSVTKLKTLSDAARNFYHANSNDIVSVRSVSSNVPDKFSLNQNFPNPFNPETNIKFAIPLNGFVELNVFDLSGKLIETLVSQNLTTGEYEVNFNGMNLSSGIYFYTLKTDKFSETKKMILVK